ncbi:hypothetical protein EW146_g5513 [Bondarzewia mesenterica]|uniref:Carboxylic ester hydrolase n=1 Tax=Bondarzewia mesenterica TaxID=1095465 RepID=A0A4S4LTC4_9AGAM|nr:hypothetical protein EW146_g5513 [Bondarzewia mesenterica]
MVSRAFKLYASYSLVIRARLPHRIFFAAGASAAYNASMLVRQSVARGTPIIYVSLNYRLGPLGFPQGPEAEARGSLNIGLCDQWAAFEWIQTNIRNFGGDPDKVTIFGQSAGAISLALHYLNENFTNVARAAIFESGSASTLSLFNASRLYPSWLAFARGTPSCTSSMSLSKNDTFSCLLTATSDEILAGMEAAQSFNQQQFPFIPVLDGLNGVVPTLPSLRLGVGAKVPFISGTVLDEGTSFFPTSVSTTNELQDWIFRYYTPSQEGSVTLEIATAVLLALYEDPSMRSPFGTGNQTFGLSMDFKRVGDLWFQGQRRIWTKTAATIGTRTYGYLFTDPQPNVQPYLGVAHSSEGQYVYGQIPANETAATLSSAIMDYWISFANSLDPNDGKGTQRPNWESYGDNQRILQLQTENTTLIEDDYRSLPIDDFINRNNVLFGQ